MQMKSNKTINKIKTINKYKQKLKQICKLKQNQIKSNCNKIK